MEISPHSLFLDFGEKKQAIHRVLYFLLFLENQKIREGESGTVNKTSGTSWANAFTALKQKTQFVLQKVRVRSHFLI